MWGKGRVGLGRRLYGGGVEDTHHSPASPGERTPDNGLYRDGWFYWRCILCCFFH